jgi:hypothetical protein
MVFFRLFLEAQWLYIPASLNWAAGSLSAALLFSVGVIMKRPITQKDPRKNLGTGFGNQRHYDSSFSLISIEEIYDIFLTSVMTTHEFPSSLLVKD